MELQLVDAVVDLTELAKARGLIDVREPRLVCLVILGAVERVLYEVLLGTDLGDPRAAADRVAELFATTLGLPVSPPRSEPRS